MDEVIPRALFISPVQIIRSPWRDQLLEAVGQVEQSLFLVSPFITTDVIADVERCLVAREGKQNVPIDVHVLTRIKFEDFHSNASELKALELLLQWPLRHQMWTVQVRTIENIHAKVWVFDDAVAIIGSGNATFSGLGGNVEYGLAVSDFKVVTQILADWQLYWLQGQSVSIDDLLPIKQGLERLHGDEYLTKAEQESRQRRQTILEELNIDISPGKRVLLPNSQKKQPVISTPGLNTSGQAIPPPLDVPSAIPPHAVCVSTYDFWRALNWVFPLTQFGLANWSREDEYLIIDWLSLSQELQLTRVNGRQLSRATIQGYTQGEMLADSRALLHVEEILWLGRQLQALKSADVAKRPLLDALWFVGGLPEIIEIKEAKQPIDAGRQIPASHRVPPEQGVKNIPDLKQPVSHITVGHIRLVERLIQLERMWHEQHRALEFPRAVELRLSGTEQAPSLIFSVHSDVHSLEVQVLGQDSHIADPTIRLRISYASLWQVLDGTLDAVDWWRLYFGCGAERVQFLPASSGHAFSRLWFHQLNGLINRKGLTTRAG